MAAPGAWKPVAFVLLATPLLTEVLSTNISLFALLSNPVVFLFLATAGYGIPVLLLRELSIRWRLGSTGLLLLGLVYGIYNEGVLAKTILLTAGLPIPTFDGYGIAYGFAVPWAWTICLWHALYAVVYPRAILEACFPDYRGKSLLLPRPAYNALLVAATVGIALLIFFRPQDSALPFRLAGTLPQLAILLGISAVLLALAYAFRRDSAPPAATGPQRRFAVAGAALLVAILIVPTLLAGAHTPLPLFYLYMLAATALAAHWLASAKDGINRLLLAAGSIFAMSIPVFWRGVAARSVDHMLSSSMFLALSGYAIWRLGRR